MFSKPRDLIEDAFRASGDDLIPLVKSYRAEAAVSDAPPVCDDGKLRKGKQRAFSQLAGEIEGVYPVEILRCVFGEFILEDVIIVIFLGKVLAVRERELHSAKRFFIRLDLSKRREPFERGVDLFREDAGSWYSNKITAVSEPAGDFDDLFFAVAVNEDIRPAVEEDAAPDLVVPIVVMRKSPERRLDAADNDLRALEIFP